MKTMEMTLLRKWALCFREKKKMRARKLGWRVVARCMMISWKRGPSELVLEVCGF